jgi:Zn-dependent metalloprotease
MRANLFAPSRHLADRMNVRILVLSRWALVLSLAVWTTSASAQTSASATRDAALQHVRGTATSKRLAINDVSELAVTDETRTKHAGVSHVYIRQKLGGIEIANRSVTVNLDAKNIVIGTRGSLGRDIVSSATVTSPTLSASGAIDRAAAHLGLVATAPRVELEPSTGPTRAALFRSVGVSLDDIPVKLSYYSLPSGALVLAWELVVRTPDLKHWWQVWVDATTGAITAQGDWIARDSYRVFEIPVESPQHGVRSLAVDPADATALQGRNSPSRGETTSWLRRTKTATTERASRRMAEQRSFSTTASISRKRHR